MTTIAASVFRRMMAADARMVITNDAFGTHVAASCTKLIRTRDWIVGCAGDTEDISRFLEWLKNRRKKRPKPECEFEALLLSPKELLYFGGAADHEEVRNGFMAIGSGAAIAMGSLTTQVLLGEDPDPRIAVLAACHHDPNSREPVDFLTWRKER